MQPLFVLVKVFSFGQRPTLMTELLCRPKASVVGSRLVLTGAGVL